MAAFKRQSFKWDYELDQKLDNFISYFFVLTLKRKLGLSGSPFLSHVTSGVGDPEILHLSLMFAPSFTVNVGRSSETFGADAEKKNFHFRPLLFRHSAITPSGQSSVLCCCLFIFLIARTRNRISLSDVLDPNSIILLKM